MRLARGIIESVSLRLHVRDSAGPRPLHDRDGNRLTRLGLV